MVREYVLDSREGSLSGFHGLRCVNCGAIHDDVIRRNQRWPTSLKGVEDLKRAMVNLRLVSPKGLAVSKKTEALKDGYRTGIPPASTCGPIYDCFVVLPVARVAESHEEPRRGGATVLKD